MKKLLIAVFCILVLGYEGFSQTTDPRKGGVVEETNTTKKEIKQAKPVSKARFLHIGSDPYEWDRVLEEGEMAVKIKKAIYVATGSGSGKVSHGSIPKGTIAIVKREEFQNGTAKNWIIAVCGNPTFQITSSKAKSLVPLDLTNCIPFAYYSDGKQVNLANDKVLGATLYIPDSLWFSNIEGKISEMAESQGRIEGYFFQLFDRMEKIEKKSYFERNWGWIVPVAAVIVGTVIYLLIPKKEVREVRYDYSGWAPENAPLGKLGIAF